jgi:hypothetical protein
MEHGDLLVVDPIGRDGNVLVRRGDADLKEASLATAPNAASMAVPTAGRRQL